MFLLGKYLLIISISFLLLLAEKLEERWYILTSFPKKKLSTFQVSQEANSCRFLSIQGRFVTVSAAVL